MDAGSPSISTAGNRCGKYAEANKDINETQHDKAPSSSQNVELWVISTVRFTMSGKLRGASGPSWRAAVRGRVSGKAAVPTASFRFWPRLAT
jgi:hypothetical protein